MDNGLSPGAILGAIRLGSSALPIGAFAYSQALEQAVSLGLVADANTAEHWVVGLLQASVLTADVPLLLRQHRAWSNHDRQELERLNDLLFAMRPSRELREEERQLGRALFRLLHELGEPRAQDWLRAPRVTLAAAYSLFGVRYGLGAELVALSYAFSWAEAQVSAATRLVPLGQISAQRVLSAALSAIDAALPEALRLPEHALSSTAPGQALLSASHETQYSRLFRS